MTESEMAANADREVYASRTKRLLGIKMGRHFSRRVYRLIYGKP